MRTTLRLILAYMLAIKTVLAANPIVVVSIDGLRPDAIKKANAQTLLSLIENGTSFPEARTVRPSVTLPAHTSMVTGIDPQHHGILWDDYRADYGPVRHVTALELLHKAGFHTVMIVAKEKLIHLNRPNSMTYFKQTEKAGAAVAEAFAAYVEKSGLPDFTFLHLPDPDTKGHAQLWMSSAYFKGVRDADKALQSIIATATNNSTGKPLTFIITADHGGFGFSHAVDIDQNNQIPFIAMGAQIAKGVKKNERVGPMDIAATVLRHFGQPIPALWQGKPAPIYDDGKHSTTPPVNDADPPIPEAVAHAGHKGMTMPMRLW